MLLGEIFTNFTKVSCRIKHTISKPISEPTRYYGLNYFYPRKPSCHNYNVHCWRQHLFITPIFKNIHNIVHTGNTYSFAKLSRSSSSACKARAFQSESWPFLMFSYRQPYFKQLSMKWTMTSNTHMYTPMRRLVTNTTLRRTFAASATFDDFSQPKKCRRLPRQATPVVPVPAHGS